MIPKKALPRRAVCLVACGKTKQNRAVPAKDMYTGDLFKKSRAWAEQNANEWAILSAKHGLLMPDTVIEPYEQRLLKNYDDQKWWARKVNDKVFEMWCHGGLYRDPVPDSYGYHRVLWNPKHESIPRIIVLAGVDYRIAFEGQFVEKEWCQRIPFEAPMRGLELGEQLSWLKTQLSDTASSH